MKLTLAVAVATFAALPVFAQTVTVNSYAGAVEVATNPDKIVALDVAAIDLLDALGVAIAGSPSNLYVDYLDDVAAQATGVGTLFEPDYEALAQLGPDLIIVGGRSSTLVEPLSEIAPVVDMTIGGDDHVAQVLSRLNALAAITGTEAQAATVQATFEATLQTATNAVDGQGDALIVMTNGPAVSAYGIGSRFGWLHAALDLPEAVEGVDAQTHGEAISFEFVAEANPDWLIVIDRGAATGAKGDSAAQTLDNVLVAGTTAAKDGQIIYLNSANIYIAGGGIQSMSGTLDEIIAAFGN